ncbi:MAG: ABC transporter ATP-binding protein [Candidatus Helarchaeota archaeon]
MKEILRLENVYKTYKLGKTEVNALNGISLTIQKGELVSIMGPSGSGKTTLLNLIGALDSPTKGKIFINEKDISKMNDRALTRLRRHEIGFIFQFYNLIPVLTAYENVELPLIAAGIKKKERKQRVLDLLTKVKLADRLKHKPEELSGGQQQRVAIARALVNRPSIVLADELTGDLDSKTGEEIMSYLISLNKLEKQTFIIVTHDMNIARKTSKIYQIKDGKISNTFDNMNK